MAVDQRVYGRDKSLFTYPLDRLGRKGVVRDTDTVQRFRDQLSAPDRRRMVELANTLARNLANPGRRAARRTFAIGWIQAGQLRSFDGETLIDDVSARIDTLLHERGIRLDFHRRIEAAEVAVEKVLYSDFPVGDAVDAAIHEVTHRAEEAIS